MHICRGLCLTCSPKIKDKGDPRLSFLLLFSLSFQPAFPSLLTFFKGQCCFTERLKQNVACKRRFALKQSNVSWCVKFLIASWSIVSVMARDSLQTPYQTCRTHQNCCNIHKRYSFSQHQLEIILHKRKLLYMEIKFKVMMMTLLMSTNVMLLIMMMMMMMMMMMVMVIMMVMITMRMMMTIMVFTHHHISR